MRSKNFGIKIILILLSLFILYFLGISMTIHYPNATLGFQDSPSISNSLYIGEDFFIGEGNLNNLSLFYERELKFVNNSTIQTGIEIINQVAGWNITRYDLNFTGLYADDISIEFETRNDGYDQFSGINQYYAVSFTVPYSCYIKSALMFIQYWGSATGLDESQFSINLYNATTIENQINPHKVINNSSDDTLFDLTNEPVNQPAKWYQSNFTSRLLDTSKTVNNTFFLVFQSIKYPNLVGFSDYTFFYYANEDPDDLYDTFLYKKSDILLWEEMSNKRGLFKINFSPISYQSNAEQVNLTVSSSNVDSSGIFFEDEFYPHQDNKFLIPITSSWFGPIRYNVSFNGQFRFDTKSLTNFYSEANQDVLWNSSLQITQFPEDVYNLSARLYYPNQWKYEYVENSTSIYTNVNNKGAFIDICECFNDDWTSLFTQPNSIADTIIQKSSDKVNWQLAGNYINSSDYINISSQFINSNGRASLYVSSSIVDIIIERDLTENRINFPIWRPNLNTSIIANNTLIQIKTITYNGTIAGISINTFRVILLVNQSKLEFITDNKFYLWGSETIIEARLSCESKPIKFELVQFNLYERYANGMVLLKHFNDTTDDEGIARLVYSVGKAEIIDIDIFFSGNVFYSSSFSSNYNIEVRSPIEQFFIDYFILILSVAIVILGLFSRLIIQKAYIKRNMKIWKQKSNKFMDILNVEFLVIIHRKSGVAIVQKNLGKIIMDGNLISGFLYAVSSFKYEIKKSEFIGNKKESMMLDYQDYKILIKDGNYIRVALILNSNPSEQLKFTQLKFIGDFESKFDDEIINFCGDLSNTDNYIDFIDKKFNFDLIKPQQVNKNPPLIKIKSFNEKIISIAKLLEKDGTYFFISNLIKYVFSAMPKEPKEKILANIYYLHEIGVIKSVVET